VHHCEPGALCDNGESTSSTPTSTPTFGSASNVRALRRREYRHQGRRFAHGRRGLHNDFVVHVDRSTGMMTLAPSATGRQQRSTRSRRISSRVPGYRSRTSPSKASRTSSSTHASNFSPVEAGREQRNEAGRNRDVGEVEDGKRSRAMKSVTWWGWRRADPRYCDAAGRSEAEADRGKTATRSQPYDQDHDGDRDRRDRGEERLD